MIIFHVYSRDGATTKAVGKLTVQKRHAKLSRESHGLGNWYRHS